MSKPWAVFGAGVCGLLAITIAVRQLRESHSAASGSGTRQGPLLSGSDVAERGGWIAKPDAGPGHGAGTGRGVGTAGGPESTGGTEVGIAGQPGRGTASVLRDAGQAKGGAGYTGTSSYPSGSVDVKGAVPAEAVPFEGARPLSQGLAGQTSGGAAGVAPGAQSEAAQGQGKDGEKDNGLVLSLPFDKSTQPEKGDLAPIVAQGITFDSGAGARFSTDSQFVIPDAGNLNGQEGAVSFCLQPQWAGGDAGDRSLVQLRNPDVWENRMQIFKNGRYLRFIFTPNTGIESGAGTAIDAWQPGQWHHVAAVWGQNPNLGENTAALYVDGQLVGQQPFDGQLEVSPGTPLYIGSDYAQGGPGAGGTLSSFQGYSRFLAPDEIANLATGCMQQ